MILVNQNLSFIQHAQLDKSWVGKTKCEIVGRITSLGTALALVAEAVSRICLALLASLGHLLTCGYWENGAAWTKIHREKAVDAAILSFDCLIGALLPKSLEGRLVKGPLSAEIRENRLRIGSDVIQRKLETELRAAQNQMMTEQNGENFQYLEGNLGTSGSERVGGYEIGYCHHIGRRPTMEDEHLAAAFDIHINKIRYPVRLFGVFDGHGGPEASHFLKTNLKKKLEQTLIEMNPNGLTDEGIWNALKLTFVRLSQDFKEESGSTATVSMILDGKLWTANVGDSRTILDNGGEIIPLSEDAKPNDPKFKKGIQNRGGDVWWAHGGMRVNGALAVARSVGDHFLDGAISARPKITMIPFDRIRPGSHLVMTCDGIYDVASSSQVGRAVRDHREQSVEVRARNLVFSAFQAESGDNLSVLVIAL